MEIVLLIIALLIFGKSSSLKNQTEPRIIAGALLGIVYFCLWPYIHYFLELSSTSDFYIQTTYVILLTVSLILTRLLLMIGAYEITMAAAIGLFITLMLLSASFEIRIKDQLAEYSGFFESPSHFNKTINNPATESKQIQVANGAYGITIPADWKEHKHHTTQLSYYRPDDTSQAIVEFRPRCYSKRKLALTEVVNGMLQIHREKASSDYQCSHWNQGYACRVSIFDAAGKSTRIRWIVAEGYTDNSLELDFIVNPEHSQSTVIADAVFNTLIHSKSDTAPQVCVSPIEWF
ncbi:MAG: hypothetical protein OEY89_06775 [Gammaproteobacteria bacterium]|nr:hypothetical protein [Gammaproteobacteria bacterium]